MPPSRPFYRPELDVVRFVAFLLVFATHTIVPQPGVNEGWERVTRFACGFGLCLFFTLSAYLITLLLLREKELTDSVRLRQFYKRRMLRIWPLYFGTLGLAAAVLLVHHGGRPFMPWFFAAVFMCGNLVFPSGLPIGHLWSISVEEQFYIFWPPLIRIFGRVQLLVAACVLVLIACASLAYYGHVHADMSWRVWSSSFVQFGMFAAGILLALFDEWRPTVRPVSAVAMAFAAVGMWMGSEAFFLMPAGAVFPEGAFSLCAGYTLVAAGGVLLIMAVPALPKPSPVVYLGKISYGLYVFHIPMLFLLLHHHEDHRALRVLVAFAGTVGVAAVSYRFYETPFLRLKRNLEVIKTRPV